MVSPWFFGVRGDGGDEGRSPCPPSWSLFGVGARPRGIGYGGGSGGRLPPRGGAKNLERNDRVFSVEKRFHTPSRRKELTTITLAYARIAKSRDSSMKFDLRLRLVRYALEHGLKPAAREFGCTPKIARKWLRRWLASGRSRQSLMDRSRAPHSCPHKTPSRVERQIVREREKAPCLGARRLKEFCAIPAGVGTIARVLRQNNLTRKRKKKHEKKRDMREVKARFDPFEENQVDVKYLNDIPYYVEQLWRNPRLPRFQYTWRDVKTGAVFLGFANELSESHACAFVAAVGAHLGRTGLSLRGRSTIQTDNGSEFSGAERKTREDRGFNHLIERGLGATHRFIPPGKKNRQADVETLHDRIEEEFFNLERFADREDFFRRASMWQLWWNTTRKNGYKGGRTPDDILLETRPERDAKVWLLPALDLDALLARRANSKTLNKSPTGGYYVPALPGMFPISCFPGWPGIGASGNFRAPTLSRHRARTRGIPRRIAGIRPPGLASRERKARRAEGGKIRHRRKDISPCPIEP